MSWRRSARASCMRTRPSTSCSSTCSSFGLPARVRARGHHRLPIPRHAPHDGDATPSRERGARRGGQGSRPQEPSDDDALRAHRAGHDARGHDAAPCPRYARYGPRREECGDRRTRSLRGLATPRRPSTRPDGPKYGARDFFDALGPRLAPFEEGDERTAAGAWIHGRRRRIRRDLSRRRRAAQRRVTRYLVFGRSVASLDAFRNLCDKPRGRGSVE